MIKKKYICVDDIKWRKEKVECKCHNDRWEETVVRVYKSDIEEMPAADVVNVVRCKDCICFNKSSQPEGYGICQIFGRMMKVSEFCCYGKERTDESTH